MKTENILWMGDIEPWMNELVIKKSFIENGFEPKNIKFIKDKKYNIFQNYCFIYFDNILDASNALCTLNGKKILNSNVNFKLNWANKNSENYKNVYVGNLPTKVTDIELYNFFKSKYPSVHHASIVRENGISKKFGFINFIDDEEYQKCLKEMDGAVFHNNIIRVKERKKKNNENEQKNNKKNNNLNNKVFYHKINNNLYKNDINNIKMQSMQSINLNEIKSFYPKKKEKEDISKTENDETTFSSQEKDQDLSLSNISISEKRKFSDNIELLESDNNKILNKKVQETINKMFEYYKMNNKYNELSNMILYYTSNNNKSDYYL